MEAQKGQYVERRKLLDDIILAITKNDVEKASRLLTSYQEDLGEDLIERLQAGPYLPVLSEVFVESKDFRRAAFTYELKKQFKEAAQYYENAQNFAKAAELYQKVGEDLAEGAALEKANRFLEAAEVFIKLNDLERAALDFSQGGDYFESGRCYLQNKNYRQAIYQFQKLKPEDYHYVESLVLVSRILAEAGHGRLARQKLQAGLKGRQEDQTYLPLQYELAKLLVEEEKYKSASKLLEQILKMNPDYKDVAAKLEEIKQIPTSEDAKEEVVPASAKDDSDKNIGLLTSMEGFEFLKDTPLFEPLSLEETKMVFDICETKKVKKGEIVIEQGIPGWGLFIIQEGELLVQLEEQGQLKDLLEIGPGNYVGEMSLVENSITSAKVIAKENCKLLAINRKRFNDLLNAQSSIKIKVLQTFVRILSERLRKTTAELARIKS